jgi:hypothetical protein
MTVKMVVPMLARQGLEVKLLAIAEVFDESIVA